MSLLWSSKNKILNFSNHKKPSPALQIKFPDPARDPDLSLAGSDGFLSGLSSFIKGTSLPASFSNRKGFFAETVQAGMTVEASIVLPLFLFFFLNIGCAIEMIRLHGNIQLALWQTGSRLSVYGYVVYSGEAPQNEQAAEKGREEEEEDGWWKGMAGMVLASTYVKAKVIDLAGRDYLDGSPLRNGADGLQLWESEIFGQGDEIDLVVTYAVAPWSSLAGFFSFRMANRYHAHIWNGYQLPGSVKETQVAFMAENGGVYHLDRNCTYLQLSVSRISALEIPWVKNQQGRRYQACERCAKEVWAAVWYITSQGDRYHYARACPGLKRTVHAVSMEEAAAVYKRCSRCGGDGARAVIGPEAFGAMDMPEGVRRVGRGELCGRY